jgi:hypothetical protein
MKKKYKFDIWPLNSVLFGLSALISIFFDRFIEGFL